MELRLQLQDEGLELRVSFDSSDEFTSHLSSHLRGDVLEFYAYVRMELQPGTAVVIKLDVPGDAPRLLHAQLKEVRKRGTVSALSLQLTDDADHLSRVLKLPAQPSSSKGSRSTKEKSTLVMMSPQQAVAEVTPEVLEERLGAQLRRLQSADHYGVLGLVPGLELDALQQRHRVLCELFDSLDAANRGSLVAAIVEEIRSIVEDAYNTLADPVTRAKYNLQQGLCDWHDMAAGPDAQQVEQDCIQFEQARTLLHRGEFREAYTLLDQITLKQHPRILSYLGWASHLLGKPGSRQLLERAIRLDSLCDEAHEFLARILKAAGDSQGARQHFWAAYEINPSRIDAYSEYEELADRPQGQVSTQKAFFDEMLASAMDKDKSE